MTPLTRKLLRDLRATAGPLATVTLTLAVGVASMVGFLGTYRDMTACRDRYYERYHFADIDVLLRRAPLGVLPELRGLPGLDRLEPRIHRTVPMEVGGVPERLAARVVSLPEHGDPELNRLRLVAGRMPRPGGAPEVVVSEDFGRARALHPGSRLTLLVEEQARRVEVVGWATSPEFVFVVPSGGGIVPEPANFGIVWARRRWAEQVFDMEGAFDDLLATVARGSSPEAMARTLERRLRRHGVLLATPREQQQSHAVLRDELRNLYNNARFLPTLFLLASALVLNLVLSRLVTTQRTQIGTMKALGLSRPRILLHYASFAVVAAAAGAGLGGALGRSLASTLARVYQRFYHLPIEAPGLHLDLIAAGLAISLGAALVGAAGAALEALALSPAEAMRPSPPEARAAGLVPRLVGLPLLWRIALRALLRHPLRAAVSTIGVALGLGLMISSQFFTDAMTQLSHFRFRVIERQDLVVFLREDAPEEALDEVARIPGVLAVEPTFGQLYRVSRGRRSRRVWISGIDPDARLRRPRDLAGVPVAVPREGVLLSEKLAEVLQVAPGQLVVLGDLRRPGLDREVPVSGTYPSYLGMDAFADRTWLARFAREPRTLSLLHLDAPGADGETDRQLARRPGVVKVSRREDKIRGFEGSVKGVLDAVAAIMLLLAGALACGMNLNGALVSLAERRRELAVLRVQGFTRTEVSDLLLYEHSLVGILGLLLGVPLGWLFASWCHTGFDTELYRLPWVLGRANLAQAMLTSVLFALAAHGVVRLWIRNHAWASDLAVKE